MAKGFGHMMNREQSKGFRGWLGYIEEAKASRFDELMQRSLGFMLNRKLAAALSSWLELVADRSSMAKLARATCFTASSRRGGARGSL